MTSIIASLLLLTILVTTVRVFYDEYSTVEEFEIQESRVKDFFHGFPAHTEIPLIEYEKDEWISYGHVDPKVFLDAIQTVLYKVTDDPTVADAYLGLETSVGHLYATFRNPDEGHWDGGLDLCKASAEGCFPITRLVKTSE